MAPKWEEWRRVVVDATARVRQGGLRLAERACAAPADAKARAQRVAAMAHEPERRVFLSRVGFGLSIGAVGGLVAHAFHVPLAFMLGALFATIAASAAGAPISSSQDLRSAFLVIVGLFLGQSFESGGAARMADWPGSILLAILYVPVASYVCWKFYERVGLDRLTALFSAIPGGLSAVILFSGALGGDERKVALSQSLRIAIVVLTAPAVFFGLLGFTEPPLAESVGALMGLGDAAILFGAAGLAIWLMSLAGAPLPFLIAPLLASAVVRLTGVVDGDLPVWLVKTALVVTGSSIGARFAGAKLKALLALGGWTLVGTMILMAISAVFALASAALFDLDAMAAILAFAPGGVAEMCLIAIALDADPSFVATHHLARIAFILLATPAFSVFVQRHLAPPEKRPGPDEPGQG